MMPISPTLDLAICYILWDLDCEIVIFDLNADILGCFLLHSHLAIHTNIQPLSSLFLFLQGVLAVSVYCYYNLIAARIDYCSTCSDISFANRCLIRHCTGDADLSDDFLLLASTSRSTSSAEAYDVTAVGGSACKTIAADGLHAASRAARILVLFLILIFLLFYTI